MQTYTVTVSVWGYVDTFEVRAENEEEASQLGYDQFLDEVSLTVASQDETDDEPTLEQDKPDWQPVYSPWRHGGWYVDNLRYPSGAVGCVSRNYPDRKWRIACDPRPFKDQPTFPNRDAAARGERDLIASMAAVAS